MANRTTQRFILPSRRTVLSRGLASAGAVAVAPLRMYAQSTAKPTTAPGTDLAKPSDAEVVMPGDNIDLRKPDLYPGDAVFVNHNLVTGTLINFGYRTPVGNRPNTNANTVYLWRVSANQIPWNSDPTAEATILLDQSAGNQNLTNISVTDGAYILGYATGPETPDNGWSKYANVIASAFIPQLSGLLANQIASQPEITPLFVGENSLSYQFKFLTGFLAARSGAWAGIWEGSAVSYRVPPKWFAPIQLASNEGVSGLNGLSLDRNQKYTVGLSPTGYTDAATPPGLLRLAAYSVFSG